MGSYACSCHDGYSLSQDKVTCIVSANDSTPNLILIYSIGGGGGGGLLLLMTIGTVISVTLCLLKRHRSKKAKLGNRF